MKSENNSKSIDVDINEALAIKDRLLAMSHRVSSVQDKQDLLIASSLLGTLIKIYTTWDKSKKTIKNLLKKFFGSSSEKSAVVTKNDGEFSSGAKSKISDQSSAIANTNIEDNSSNILLDSENIDRNNVDNNFNDEKKKRKGGNGRNSCDNYTGAIEIEIALENQYLPGKTCPECKDSRLYKNDPEVSVRLVGHAPVVAYKFMLEVSRCICGMIFKANIPSRFQDLYNADKYGPSAIAAMLTYKYLMAVTFGLLDKVQAMHGVPLPASTQANQIKKYAVEVIRAVVVEMKYLAANAYLLGVDDTVIRLLEKRITTKNTETNRGHGTAIIANHFDDDDNIIALYDFDYSKHAGKVIMELLSLREEDKNLPIIATDGLESYGKCKENGIDVGCNVHLRRKVIEEDPDQKTFTGMAIIECYRTIYFNDRHCNEQKFNHKIRMNYHLENSKYSFDKIHAIFEILTGKVSQEELIALRTEYKIPSSVRIVERNSDLYKISEYFLKRAQALTRVMYVPGVPLDTNYVERAIKAIIRIRKNSLFFENLESAKYSGDILSLLQTTTLSKINAFMYVEFLITNREKVIKNPRDYLPWLYDKDSGHKEIYWKKMRSKNLLATNPLEYPFYERTRSDKLTELLMNE